MRIEELEVRANLSTVWGGANIDLPASLASVGTDVDTLEVGSDPLIAFTVELTDANKTELTKDLTGRYVVIPGASFLANIYVDDLRDVGASGGVFSAYANMTTNAGANDFQFSADLVFGPGFDLEQTGTVQPTVIQNAGALRENLISPGSGPKQLLYSVQVQAGANVSEGASFSLQLEQGDVPPDTQNLVFGVEGRAPGSYEEIQLVVVSRPWRNSRDANDVNDDGRTSLRDLLNIINALLASGGSFGLGLPTVTKAPPFFYDVTGDGLCSVLDVERVVEHFLALNSAYASLSQNPVGVSAELMLTDEPNALEWDGAAAIPDEVGILVVISDEAQLDHALRQSLAPIAAALFARPRQFDWRQLGARAQDADRLSQY